MRPRAGIFMPMMPICLATAMGQQMLCEASVVRVGSVESQQDLIEVEATQALH